MSDDVLLLTGASGGVGASLCRHLRDRYHLVPVVRDLEKLEERVGPLDDMTPMVADLSRRGEVDEMLDGLTDRFDHVPYVINNAGVNLQDPVRELDREDIVRSLEVNALTPVRILKSLLPTMVDRDFGRVINVTSGAPFNCVAGYGAYSASKAALNAFTVTAANEHDEENIRINLMSPGPVRSGMAPDAPMDPSVCHPTVDYLLELSSDGPTGRFFWLGHEIPLSPDLDGVEWLEGRADEEQFPKVVS